MRVATFSGISGNGDKLGNSKAASENLEKVNFQEKSRGTDTGLSRHYCEGKFVDYLPPSGRITIASTVCV